MKRLFPFATAAATLVAFGGHEKVVVYSFVLPRPSLDGPSATRSSIQMSSQSPPPPPNGPAGSFFHRVPDDVGAAVPNKKNDASADEDDGQVDDVVISRDLSGDDDTLGSNNNNKGNNDNNIDTNNNPFDVPEFDIAISKLLEQRRRPPRASRPSTINGIPTEKVSTGFGKISPKRTSKGSTSSSSSSKKPYVALGPQDNNDDNSAPTPPMTFFSQQQQQPINDPTKPEFDDQGYTLYTDRVTGKKSRVFEALVDYPCTFTLKIVGANEGDFVRDILAVIAEACDAPVEDISHSTKQVGTKWTSVTVLAPVKHSEMLYTLYEKVDLDPRVKFKF